MTIYIENIEERELNKDWYTLQSVTGGYDVIPLGVGAIRKMKEIMLLS